MALPNAIHFSLESFNLTKYTSGHCVYIHILNKNGNVEPFQRGKGGGRLKITVDCFRKTFFFKKQER